MIGLNQVMKIFFLFFLLFLIPHAYGESIRILTWNVFMLPKPINWSAQELRSKLIVNELKKGRHDVVVLQEAFDWKIHARLKLKLRKIYPYQYYLGRKLFSMTVYGSGVYFLSKYPFKNLSRVYFNQCGKADCLASKGSSVIEVSLSNNKKIQIASTHMQAGAESRYSDVRFDQLGQIKKMLAKVAKPSVPQFLLGDLNIDALSGSDYVRAQQFLGMASHPLEGGIPYSNGFPTVCYSKPGSDEKEWLDHIFMNAMNTKIEVKEKKVIPYYGIMNGQNCPLSDHYGVEALLTFH